MSERAKASSGEEKETVRKLFHEQKLGKEHLSERVGAGGSCIFVLLLQCCYSFEIS